MDKKGRNTAEHYAWRNKIKERDRWQCTKCFSKEKLHAHHIIPWKVDKEKRFDLNNGITLCASCHKKEDGVVPAGWNKGLKRPIEWCQKLSESCKGRKAWNKGLTGLTVSPKTQFKKGNVPWNTGRKYVLPQNRECKMCKEIKTIDKFTPQQKGKYYSYVCKICRINKLKD